jgi:hypothetical protein
MTIIERIEAMITPVIRLQRKNTMLRPPRKGLGKTSSDEKNIGTYPILL